MTQIQQREEESPGPAARPRTVVLAERIPIRRIILVTLSILIAAGVLIGSYKTLTLTEGRISAAGWRDFLVFGVALGSIYALIALGYSLVYGILLMINFAHGEVFMMGAFASYFVARSLEPACSTATPS
jgi:branched-chain amino acid transport system permease protein